MIIRSLFYSGLVVILLCAGCGTRPSGPVAGKPADQASLQKGPRYGLERDLSSAVGEDDLQRVRSLIAKGASVHGGDNGWQLHLAAEAGHCEIAECLIAAGADVNARDPGNTTPLHLAIHYGRKAMVELLLASGADVNARGVFGQTPLQEAVEGEYVDPAMELVYARWPDANDTNDLSGLHDKLAAELAVEITQILLKYGADVRIRDEYGGTVLSSAFIGGSLPVIDVLLAHGVDPDGKEAGLPALSQAMRCWCNDALPLLLERGANVNARDRDRQTPLHEAVWQGDVATVELFISHKAAINARDRNGDTPGHIAARIGDVGLYDLLVTKGADTKAKNKQGLTPPDCARLAPPREMIKLSEDGARPYSVIVTDLRGIRGLLHGWQMEMMHIRAGQAWVPSPQDIKQAEIIMRLARARSGDGRTRGRISRGYLSADIDQCNREYAGFTRGKARYVICHMSSVDTRVTMPDNDFTSVWDGGCSVMLVVIDLGKRQVLGAVCNEGG